MSGVGQPACLRPCGRRGSRPAVSHRSLTDEELDRLRRELRGAVRSAIRKGGVHTGASSPPAARGALPRDGHSLSRATVGGRTTYWCPACQL